MHIGASIDVDRPFAAVVEQVQGYPESGLSSAWAAQVFGYDSLTLFAALAQRVPRIAFGTGVVPVYSRHPQVMAQQALSVQAFSGGRLTLGIGLSHQVVIEGLWGLSYDRPVRYLSEYLDALCPMLAGESVSAHGEVVTCVTYSPLEIPEAPAPTLLVAALGPAMLKLAAERATGTVTWMTGRRTIAEHIVPTISAAARAAGRPAPAVVASLPVVVTADAEAARERIDRAMAIYPSLPSYQAMLEREGASSASEISLVGTEDEVASAVGRLADAGVTDSRPQSSAPPRNAARPWHCSRRSTTTPERADRPAHRRLQRCSGSFDVRFSQYSTPRPVRAVRPLTWRLPARSSAWSLECATWRRRWPKVIAFGSAGDLGVLELVQFGVVVDEGHDVIDRRSRRVRRRPRAAS